jgi:hypothetical protein
VRLPVPVPRWRLVRQGKVAIFIACTVTGVWALSTLWAIVHPAYRPDPGIHTVMLAVAGGFLGTGLVQKRRDGNGKDGH